MSWKPKPTNPQPVPTTPGQPRPTTPDRPRPRPGRALGVLIVALLGLALLAPIPPADAAYLRCGQFNNGHVWGCGRVVASWANGRNVQVYDGNHGYQCVRVKLQRKSTAAWIDTGVSHCSTNPATYSVSLGSEVSGVRIYYGWSASIYRTIEY